MYAIRTLGLSEKTVGLIIQQRAIFATVSFIILGRSSFWHFNWVQMLLSQFLLGLITFLLGYVNSNLSMGILFGLIGFLSSLSYFNSVFHGVSGSPRRSTRMAINESLISMGQIVGALFGSFIYENVSMRMVYFFSSILAFSLNFLQLVLIYYFYRRGILEKNRTD